MGCIGIVADVKLQLECQGPTNWNDIYVPQDGQVAAQMFVLLCQLTSQSECCTAACGRLRRSSADAVSCRVRPQAEEKYSPFDFSAKNIRNVGISILQEQQMKHVAKLWAHNASTPIFICF